MLEKNFINFNDINYDKLDEILLSGKFVKENRKSKVEYLDLSVSFDTETTSTKVNDQKIAFTYFWQFGFTDEFYCYGRTWIEFRTLLNYISSRLELSPEHAIIVYVHNLSFEFQFMRKYFKWENVFSVKDRTPIKAMTVDGIEFRDSYILSGLPLRLVAENLTKHKIKKLVGDLNYSLIRTPQTPITEKELGYMLNDVVILIYYIDEQREQYGDISKIPLTNTGRVRRYVKEQSKKAGYVTRVTMKWLQLTPVFYTELKQAFAGGFTHANSHYVGKIVENVQSMDFTSSYPTVILAEKRYPMSKPQKYNFVSKEKFIKDLHNPDLMFFFQADFTELITRVSYENYISKSKCIDSEEIVENNGRVWSAHKLSIVLTSVDFEIIEKAYQWLDVEFSRIVMFTTDYLPSYLLKSAVKFYQQKTTLKGVVGKEREYLLYKGMLNSLYGMMVTDIAKPEITYSNDWGKELLDLDDVIDKYNNSKTRFLYYAWGVVVTALARRNLWQGIFELKDDYVYSDTDSVKFINREKHKEFFERYNQEITQKLKTMCTIKGLNYDDLAPKTVKGVSKPLGVWDDDGFYTLFKTLGAKRYALVENGQLKTTIAGLGKKAGADYLMKQAGGDTRKALKLFKIGLSVPAEKTGKNTHTYIDECFTCNITDYLGNTCEVETLSGVHLEPASFEMTIAPTFAEFLANLVTTGNDYLDEIERI